MSTAFHKITPGDANHIALISDWYQQEWNIPTEKTINNLSKTPSKNLPLQVMMYAGEKPVATGGVYDHVALLDREPRFKVYQPWLALVYTIPAERNKGYGRMLCEEIQKMAKEMGLKEMYLFTHTAEDLYARIGWEEAESLTIQDKNIVVMRLEL
ncbi:MAG: hypothetical protein K0S33_2886 [Bacteroidetes bacterium]|nr:hypothetical protein [Bacteroidota bacterium]